MSHIIVPQESCDVVREMHAKTHEIDKDGDDGFVFEDSPVKMPVRDILQRKGLKDKVHIISKGFASEKELEVLSPRYIVVSMREAGSGDKLLRGLLKEFGQLKVEAGLEKKDETFWRNQILNWRDFGHIDVKLLVACDIIESLQMRLTFFFEDANFWQLCAKSYVNFEPFQQGMYSMSYAALVWADSQLDPKDPDTGLKKAWYTYAMEFAENMYIKDLFDRGYTAASAQGQEDSNTVSELSRELRKEVTSYLLHVKRESSRNDIAHVFSNAMGQRTYRGEDYNATSIIRALTAIPRHSLTGEKTQRLLAMITNLSDVERLPEVLKGLKTSFSLQLFFLRSVLEVKLASCDSRRATCSMPERFAM